MTVLIHQPPTPVVIDPVPDVVPVRPQPLVWRAARHVYRVLLRLQRRPPSQSPPPRITLVTPVLNGAATIAETIASVRAQHYPNLEYVIADGGSSDTTLEIVKAAGDIVSRVVSGPDKGMYDALNKGFHGASGEIFGYLNADDVLEANALRRVAAAFTTAGQSSAIYFEDIVEVRGWRFPNRAQPRRLSYADMLGGHTLFQDGVFFRADGFAAIGGFDADLKLAGDWDFFTRLRARGRFRCMTGHVSRFRVSQGQLSGDYAGYVKEQSARQSAMHAALPAWQRAAIVQVRRLRKIWSRLGINRRQLFYPFHVDLYGVPAGRLIDGDRSPPLCPASDAGADRLLFSTPDTRFGDPALNCVYFNDTTGIAIAWPKLDNAALKPLYEKHYSNPAPILLDRHGASSPYRGYWGGSRLLKALLRLPALAAAANTLTASLPVPPDRAAAASPATMLATIFDTLKAVVRTPISRQWRDHSADEILAATRGVLTGTDSSIRFLDVGCFDGTLLDALKLRTSWHLSGLELNDTASVKAQSKGHQIWLASAETAHRVLPADQRFEVIYLGQVIEHLVAPRDALVRLGMLLAPGGVIVISTPNLDSWQLGLFGPTWSHWHLPYHRHLFTLNGMRTLINAADLELRSLRTASHPYWTAMSLQLNAFGLTGAVSQNAEIGRPGLAAAWRIFILSRLLHDWRGRGDYMIAVAREVA